MLYLVYREPKTEFRASHIVPMAFVEAKSVEAAKRAGVDLVDKNVSEHARHAYKKSLVAREVLIGSFWL